MSTIALITICLLFSYVFGELAAHMGLSKILGQIVAGIVLGLPIFSGYFPLESILQIEFLADIGIIFLFLFIGLELNLGRFKAASHDTLFLGTICFVLPFVLGYVVATQIGLPMESAVVIGVCLSITSEFINTNALMNLKVFSSRLGQIIFGAGLVDEILGILMISLIIALFTVGGAGAMSFIGEVLLFVLISFALVKIVPKVFRFCCHSHSRVESFSAVLIIGLIIATLSEYLNLGPMLGALIAGVILQLSIKDKREEQEDVEELKVITMSLVVPFFFIWVGLQFDFAELLNNWELVLILLAVGFVGKFGGVFIARPFLEKKTTMQQASLLGWAMNSRGMIEIIIAQLAFEANLISVEIYTAIIAIAIIPTAVFLMILKYSIAKYPKIMN